MFPGPYFGKTYFPGEYFPQGAGSGITSVICSMTASLRRPSMTAELRTFSLTGTLRRPSIEARKKDCGEA